jgi:hypothetical protein
MKAKTIASILFLLVTSVSGKLVYAQTGCSLINKKESAQYISYERIDKIAAPAKTGRWNVVLRLYNNSNCDIILKVYDPALSKEYALIDDFPEGLWLESLKYEVEYEEALPPPKKRVIIDDTIIEFRLFAGRSVTLSIPLDTFDKWVSIKVPFRYEWDPYWFRPSHYAIFGNLDLPDDVLRRTAVCRKIQGCKPARPNNSFNRSAKSIAFVREARMVSRLIPRPVNSGVRLMPALLSSSVVWPLTPRLNASPSSSCLELDLRDTHLLGCLVAACRVPSLESCAEARVGWQVECSEMENSWMLLARRGRLGGAHPNKSLDRSGGSISFMVLPAI